MQDYTTLAQQISAAAPAATRNVNLSTDPKRMAIIEVPFVINRENVI